MAECSVEGCDNSASARGWCSAHYGRWRRSGTADRDSLVCQDPPVPPHVLAWVERVLAERNVDNKVPFDIACDLLDAMARVSGAPNVRQRHNTRSFKEAS